VSYNNLRVELAGFFVSRLVVELFFHLMIPDPPGAGWVLPCDSCCTAMGSCREVLRCPDVFIIADGPVTAVAFCSVLRTLSKRHGLWSLALR
jgi:hypothetical protein